MNNFKSNINIEIFSLKEKWEFFNSFYLLYASNMPIIDCFKSIMKSASKKNIKKFCGVVSKNIEKGASFREAVLPYSHAIGKAYTMLLITGEESGSLDNTLNEIENNLSKEEEILNNMISSLTYPVCVFLLAIGVFFFCKFFLLKVFASFQDNISQQEVINLLIIACIKIAIIYIFLGIIAFYVYLNKQIQRKFLDIVYTIPLISNILKDYYFKNFFSVFSLAYKAGIPVYEALNLSSSVIGIPSVNKSLKKSEKMISGGCKLIQALTVAGLFPGNILSQIASGEEAGTLDKTMNNISQRYEKSFDVKVKTAAKVIEPILMIFIGFIVFYVVYNGYKGYYEGIMSMF